MHCLVVDPNLAFATLLSEELVRLGYQVTMCGSGADAAAVAQSTAPQVAPQLALLDMALREPDALTLGHQLRLALPSIRLVLIPMIGEEPVLADAAPAIQGVLPKPFFLPELPERIAAALRAPMQEAHSPATVGAPPYEPGPQAPCDGDPVDLESVDWGGAASVLGDGALAGAVPDGDGVDVDVSETGAPSPVSGDDLMWLEAFAHPPVHDASPDVGAAQPVDDLAVVPLPSVALEVDAVTPAPPRGAVPPGISRRALRVNQEQITDVMRELANEVGADAVLLGSETGVLAWVGSLDEDEITSISTAVLHSRRASEEVARILGREQLLFEQSTAGGSYLLYALNVHDAVLAVTVSGPATLGLLRHRTRSAGERIADLCSLG